MTSRSFCLCLSALLAAAAPGLRAQSANSSPTAGAPAVSPIPMRDGNEMISSFELAGADIDGVLGALQTYTGRTIIRTAALPVGPGGYTLKIAGPLPKSEVVLALETLLELNNVGVTPLGDKFLKVVPLVNIRAEAPQLIEGSTLDLPPSGRVATKLFQLHFLRVGEFFGQTLFSMFSPGIGGVGGGVVVLEKANAAIVTDTIANLQRIETLIDQLDQPVTVGLAPKFYQLQSDKASDLVTKLNTILTPDIKKELGTATSYTADDRTNQIILIADPREWPLFDRLIAQLDSASAPTTRNEVIFLKHADATQVATELGTIISGQNANVQKAASDSVRPGQMAAPGGGQSTGAPGTASGPNGQPAPNNQPAIAAVANAVMANAAHAENSSAVFSSYLTIEADERSNSIIVSGTKEDISLVKDIIDKVDVLLSQVSISVIIAEVDLADNDNTGLGALDLTYAGGHITNFDTGTGPNGIAGWNITGGVVNPLAFQAALGSTGSTSKIKILYADTIVTTHNKQAMFSAGELYPETTSTQSSLASTGGSAVTTASVSYQNIGVKVTVTPLIGDDGSVQLTIDQTVSSLGASVNIGSNQTDPVTNSREATSFVNVQDGQMVVLGGLQQTSVSLTSTKFGLFYTIPILSNILGARSNSVNRTELLLFVLPHVLPPLTEGADAQKSINTMSNKDQIQQYLKDPSKVPKDSIYEQYFKQ